MSPKLCSMNPKSVSTSPRKLAAKSGQLRKDADAMCASVQTPSCIAREYTTSPWGASLQPWAAPDGVPTSTRS